MAWTNFPVSVGDDIQSYLVWNELIKAVYERQLILKATTDVLQDATTTSLRTATGIVNVTAASAAVVGTGTLFLTEFVVGDMIWIERTGTPIRDAFIVSVITDDTNMTLDRAYALGAISSDIFRLPGSDFFRATHVSSLQDSIEGLFSGLSSARFIDFNDNGGDWDGVGGPDPKVDIIPPWTWGDDGPKDITKPAFADVARDTGSGDFWTRVVERTGTIGVTNGSQTVDGIGTAFLTEYDSGDAIWIKGEKLEILSVTDDELMSLTVNWTDVTASGLRHHNASQIGNAQIGDVLALEFINEMYRVLSLCKWTRNTTTIIGTAGTSNRWDGYTASGSDPGPPADPDAAYADFVANWVHSWNDVSPPLPKHGVAVSRSPLPSTATNATGRVDRFKLRINKNRAISTAVDWYVWASVFSTAGTNQFDDKGFGLTQDAYNKEATSGASAAVQITTGFLFDDSTVPARPAIDPGAGASSDRGFAIADFSAVAPAPAADRVAIVKWIGLASS